LATPNPVTERYGSLSAVGIVRESSFGLATTPQNFLPATDVTLESDPGLFYPPVMMGLRDLNIFPLYGQRKNTGDVSAPLYPTNGIPALTASIGYNGGDYTTAIAGTSNYGVTGVAVSGGGVSTIATTAITQAAVVLNTNATTTVSIASGTLTGSAVPVYNFPGAATVPGAGTTTFTGATVTGTTLTNTATDTGQAIAGINTVTVGTVTGAAFAAGQYVQIDVNSSSTTAEVRKITNVSSSVLTLDYPLFFTHAIGAGVKAVTGPYTHTIVPGNTLPSLTIEKNIGGYQSVAFTGSRVDKYSVKVSASDAPIEMSATVTSQSFQILGGASTAVVSGATSNVGNTIVTYTTTANHNFVVGQQVTIAGVASTGGAGTFNVTDVILSVPATNQFTLANTVTATFSSGGSSTVKSVVTPVIVSNELPYVFSEAIVNLNFGTGYGGNVQASQVSNISIDVENGVKPTYTFNGSHDLQFLTPVTRKITGQLDVVFTSLTDAQWGFWSIMQGQVQGSMTLSFTHPSGTLPASGTGVTGAGDGGYGMTFSLPAVNFAKYADALKIEDVVMTTLNFEAAYPIGASAGSGTYGPNLATMQTQIIDSSYLPF